jgi:UDP-2,3-diacylglucosamine hydrolase
MQQQIGFISDLHLSPRQSEITALFEQYIKTSAKQLSELYILGDLFDYWIGSDYDQEYNQHILELLKQLTSSARIFFMHGNRDFLITAEELAGYNITLLTDPSIITIDNRKILLTHGDQLCTLDRNYQIMRQIFQHRYTKKIFLNMPLKIRKAAATTTRTISNNENEKKNSAKLSTVTQAVLEFANKYEADMIVHGHTHSKQIDAYELDDKTVTRLIMPSWSSENGCELTIGTKESYQFNQITLL